MFAYLQDEGFLFFISIMTMLSTGTSWHNPGFINAMQLIRITFYSVFKRMINTFKISSGLKHYISVMKMLLIEDEKDIAESLISYFMPEGYIIDKAATFSEGIEKLNINEYECALVDLMLPGGDGMNLVKMIKNKHPKCGIIIISAKEALDEKIKGLNIGADDYLTKPFHLAELNARIKSLMRRKQFDGNSRIIINEIVIDVEKRELYINKEPVELTRREFDLLIFFVSNKERALTKEAITEHVWGDNSTAFDNMDFIYTHIKNLRKKLKESGAGDYIKSVYGIGYKFSIK